MPKRVLLVFPDEDAGLIYGTLLTVKAGLLVEHVTTSMAGFERCSLAKPNLVLTDYPMYIEHERTLVRALRESGIDVPIVAVSVQAHPRLIAEAYQEGVTLYLRAPILPLDLWNSIAPLLSGTPANMSEH